VGGTTPSPVTLRLMKAPERDILSPRERAIGSAWVSRRCRYSRQEQGKKSGPPSYSKQM